MTMMALASPTTPHSDLHMTTMDSQARQLHIPITSKTSHSLVNTECTTFSLLPGKTDAPPHVSIRLRNHTSQNVGFVVSLLAQLHNLEHNVEEQHAAGTSQSPGSIVFCVVTCPVFRVLTPPSTYTVHSFLAPNTFPLVWK
jgi:hypothetical protein